MFIVRVTFRQHQSSSTAGHIVAMLCAPTRGRNSHWLNHCPGAEQRAAKFRTEGEALAALDSIGDTPNRISYTLLPAPAP